jgi:hypothetical protein
MKYLKIILRILVGGTFILSAILKLLSIDQFEMYIYSFGIFNFFLTSVLSRLLISFEFLLGVFVIGRFFYQKTWWLMMLTMIGFTLFLIYTAIFRNDTNCHCFGSFIEIDPVGSIIKNLIIIGLLIPIKKQSEFIFRWRKWVIGIVTGAILVVTFILIPPDSVYNKIYKPNNHINQEVFQEILQDSTKTELTKIEGKHILAFFVSGCKFCKMSMQKVDQIFKQNHIPVSKFNAIILGSQIEIDTFQKATKTYDYKMYNHSNPAQFLNTVYGSFPTLLYMEGDSICKVVNFRGINEGEMVQFLKKF